MVAGNGCGCDFPTTSTALNEFFAENFPKHQSFVDWKKWLLRFRDPSIPEIREWLNAEPCHCYEENWLFNRDTLKSRTLKKEFQFLGETYYIFEDSRVHKISGTCWTEYSVSKQAAPKDDFEVSLLGYSFDENNVGNGMSQAETEALIKNLLVEVFGPLDFSVRPRSYDFSKNMIEIRDDYACALPDYDVLSQVMNKLKGANKAYNRKEVQDSLAELKDYVKENYFLNSKEGVAALIEKYPDIQLGYPLNVYYRK